jgi:hypothetical protein
MNDIPCSPCLTLDGAVCMHHRAAWHGGRCLTEAVLETVKDHRRWQATNHGSNRDVPDGTGPDVEWLEPVVDSARSAYVGGYPASGIEELFREEWDYPKDGTPEEQAEARSAATWLRMLREEVAEAFAAEDDEALERELVQVAALAVSWVEKLRERRLWQYGVPHRDGPGVYSAISWDHPSTVMREQHGMDWDGPVDLVRRHVGGEWEPVP